MTAPGIHPVAVDGGELVVEVLPGSSDPVLAVHGLSSQRKLWNWLRAAAPELTLVAPDLRGRGDSVAVGGPSSIARHAADMVAVIDALGLESVHVCGMSMGGFIGVELAATHPDRVRSLVLVDGGFPFAPPPGLTRELAPTVFADRFARLGRTWELDEYVDFFVAQTAPLLDPADPLLRDNLAHDLRDGTVRLDPDVVTDDAVDVFFGENRWQDVAAPIHLLHAEWSAGADTPPGYAPEDVERYRPHTASTTFQPGCDHAASIMSHAGAAFVADVLRRVLAAS